MKWPAVVTLLLLALVAFTLPFVLGVWGFLFALVVGATGFTVGFIMARK